MKNTVSALALATCLPSFLFAQSPPIGPQAAVEAFHTALERGDREAALALLAPEVTIFESGEAELSRQEYAAHHLAADVAFVAATREQIVYREAHESGDMSWVLTRSRTTGRLEGRDIDVDGTESVILTRTSAGWHITHIHWSSHRR
ncbi:MAG TPA: nuclear transport factor 2 family protein [Thermoanaerobaculia bacterium]|nr:nuclear transport factor 2 family protein [Thermoanaerobaculia bacterium]